ncbi:MAG: Zn-dependent alcohol dehydrogenase [Acidobacteria bacterium]|nr:MAG: Zn-dependent alcohol dehydrogenase [Acidobacteriota bacterium]
MADRTMAAVVHYARREGAVELREVSPPADLADDDVLLVTRAVGICGSEVHQYHNTHSWNVRVPVILGHEFCGVVARVGKSVAGFHEGDRVTSETAARICGRCIYCRTGEYNLCPERLGFGYGLDGGMAEYVKVPARCLHHLPDSVSFERAALTEPCCVAYNATCVKTSIRPGDSVLVLGPGPIGLLCLAMAKISGAGWLGVAGLKKDERRLAVGRSVGADQTIVYGETELPEVVHSVGDGLGVDVVIDATGVSSTLEAALAAVRPGGQITKVGWGPQPLGFSLDALVQKAARIQGSFSHNFLIWEKVIALLAAGRFDPLLLVGRTAPLEQWKDCFDEMACGKIVKGVLKPAEAGAA